LAEKPPKYAFFAVFLPSEEGGFLKRAQFAALDAFQRHFPQVFHGPNSDHQVICHLRFIEI
jgi:hypothetical protein